MPDTPNNKSPRYLARFVLLPSPQEEEIISYYLERTRYLWNYMVEALREDTMKLMLCTRSSSFATFSQRLNDVYQKLINPDSHPSDFPVAVRDKIIALRELPIEMLRQRIKNLQDSYQKAYYGLINESIAPFSAPSIKGELSRLTAQFTVPKSDVIKALLEKKGVVTIGHPIGFDIDLSPYKRELLKKLKDGEEYSTKGYLQFSISRSYGGGVKDPQGKNVPSYVVTVRFSDLLEKAA